MRAHQVDYRNHGDDMQFVEVELDPGESAVAEAGSMMYMTSAIEMETIFGDGSQSANRGVLDALFGGEGLFFATLTGPGRVWLQSLPCSRLAARLRQAMPVTGSRREEGSILGGIGDLLDGDR